MAEEVKATKEEIAAGLELLKKKQIADAKHKAKVEAGLIKPAKKYSEMTPEEKAKVQERDRRYLAKQRIMLRKAKEAGITVTDAEVDAEMKIQAGATA